MSETEGRWTWLVGASQVRAALVMLGRPDAEVSQVTDDQGDVRVIVNLAPMGDAQLQLLGDRLSSMLTRLVGETGADELMGVVQLVG